MDSSSTLRLTRTHESSAANTFRISDDPPVFVRGEGPWLCDEDGGRWLDLVCGSGTSNLGHDFPAHADAIREALATGIVHTGTRLPSPFRAGLYDALASILPDELSCIQLANSGAEAVESAIKAAQFTTGRSRLIAFEGGYHGRTLGALSVTSGERLRRPFALLRELVSFVPYPDPARGTSLEQCLDGTSAECRRLDGVGEPAAAIIVEAIQGVSGVRVPPPGFLERLREISDRHGSKLICDEIWCGFGRAGRWFAFERDGTVPDMVVVGKALSGGMPLSGVAASPAVLQAWPAGIHTSTFQGNPVACNMAVATIRAIREQRLLEHVSGTLEPALGRGLRRLSDHPRVSGVRIAGAQAAIDISGPTGRPDGRAATAIQAEAMKQGLLVYAGGLDGNSVMVVPPINISEGDLTGGLELLAELILSLPETE